MKWHFFPRLGALACSVLLILAMGTGSRAQMTLPLIPNGDGSIGNPYRISNLSNLRYLSEHEEMWNRHFIQTADIDASNTAVWNEEGGVAAGFLPIGTDENSFVGSYDGQGFKITNLRINRSDKDYIALFASLSKARIVNVHLENPIIEGHDYVGAIAGYAYNSFITHCSVTDMQVKGREYVGGLLGFTDCCETIRFCSVEVNNTDSKVEGVAPTPQDKVSYIGGLVGGVSASTLRNSYSRCVVISDDAEHSGGFIGDFISGAVISCYSVVGASSSNVIKSHAFCGKFAAECRFMTSYFDNSNGESHPTVSGCNGMALTNVLPTGFDGKFWQKKTDGSPVFLTGQAKLSKIEVQSGGTVKVLQNGTEILAGGAIAVGADKTITVKMIPQDNSFQPTAIVVDGQSVIDLAVRNGNDWDVILPARLSGVEYEISATFTAGVPNFQGEGTEQNPYQIATLDDLKQLSLAPSLWSRHFIQTADIDASETATWDQKDDVFQGFSPIGLEYSKFFTGSYNGQEKKIENLNINRKDSDVGLFAKIKGAKVKNVVIVNPVFSGETAGGLVADASEDAIISNCRVENASITVDKGTGYAGGLVAFASGVTVSDCKVTTVKINAKGTHVGGFIGRCEGISTVSGCRAESVELKGTATSIGGFAGHVVQGDIGSCAVVGVVINGDATAAGGFVALAESNTTFEYCMSAKSSINLVNASVTAAQVAGFCGASKESLFAACYTHCAVNVTVPGDGSEVKAAAFTGRVEASGSFNNCYAKGAVKVNNVKIKDRGFAQPQNSTLANCYYWNSGGVTNYGADVDGQFKGLNTKEMRMKASFVGFDFKNVWAINEGIGYPYLKASGNPNEGNEPNEEDDAADVDTPGNNPVLSALLNSVLVFPNPFSGTLRVGNAGEVSRYALYNAIGQPVLSGIHAGGTELILQTAEIPAGVYILFLEAKDGVRTIKVTK